MLKYTLNYKTGGSNWECCEYTSEDRKQMRESSFIGVKAEEEVCNSKSGCQFTGTFPERIWTEIKKAKEEKREPDLNKKDLELWSERTKIYGDCSHKTGSKKMCWCCKNTVDSLPDIQLDKEDSLADNEEGKSSITISKLIPESPKEKESVPVLDGKVVDYNKHSNDMSLKNLTADILLKQIEDFASEHDITTEQAINIIIDNEPFPGAKELILKRYEYFPEILNLNFDTLCYDLATNKIPPEKQTRKRKYVYSKLKNFIRFRESDLISRQDKLKHFFNAIDHNQSEFFNNLIELYDKAFFENKLKEFMCRNNCNFIVCWNNRCTTTGGICRYKRRVDISNELNIRIELSPKVLYKAINQLESSYLINSGIKCKNILECLLITFEHELIHALIGCFCSEFEGTNYLSPGNWKGKTNPSNGHSKTFMSIVNNLFGHTDFVHELLRDSYKLDSSSSSWNPYKNLLPGYIITVKSGKTMFNGKVLKTGGKNTKNCIIYNLLDNKTYKVPYTLIISYIKLDGSVINK